MRPSLGSGAASRQAPHFSTFSLFILLVGIVTTATQARGAHLALPGYEPAPRHARSLLVAEEPKALSLSARVVWPERRLACWTARTSCLHFHNIWRDDVSNITSRSADSAAPTHQRQAAGNGTTPSEASSNGSTGETRQVDDQKAFEDASLSVAARFDPPLRLFIDMAAYNLSERGDMVARVLRNAGDMCEGGVDVDIVVHTASRNFEHVAEAAPHCARRGSKVRVEFDVRDPEIGHNMTSLYRARFGEAVNSYDYFVYMEDDLDFTMTNLRYLISEYERLRGTGRLLPGLVRVEYSGSGVGGNPEEDVWVCPEPYFPTQVFQHGGRSYLAPYNAYHAMFFLPREVVVKFARDARWLASESLAPRWLRGTPRAYQAGLWVHEFGYSYVHPQDCFPDCFVHHMPNNYLAKGGEEYPNEYRVRLGEFLHIMGQQLRPHQLAASTLQDLLVEPLTSPAADSATIPAANLDGSNSNSRSEEPTPAKHASGSLVLQESSGAAAAEADGGSSVSSVHGTFPAGCMPGVLQLVAENVTEADTGGHKFDCCGGRYRANHDPRCRLAICFEPRAFGRKHAVMCRLKTDEELEAAGQNITAMGSAAFAPHPGQAPADASVAAFEARPVRHSRSRKYRLIKK